MRPTRSLGANFDPVEPASLMTAGDARRKVTGHRIARRQREVLLQHDLVGGDVAVGGEPTHGRVSARSPASWFFLALGASDTRLAEATARLTRSRRYRRIALGASHWTPNDTPPASKPLTTASCHKLPDMTLLPRSHGTRRRNWAERKSPVHRRRGPGILNTRQWLAHTKLLRLPAPGEIQMETRNLRHALHGAETTRGFARTSISNRREAATPVMFLTIRPALSRRLGAALRFEQPP